MEAIAKARFQRVSPRKARVVLNMVRGQNVAEALVALRNSDKGAAPMVAKLIDSAIANARNKDGSVNLDSMVVKTCFADKAPNRHMRRWRPRAQGRATQVVKGMSHLTVVVSDGAEK